MLTSRDIEDELFRKTMLKYTIIRIRNKISFEAFTRKMTISELFCRTILYSLGKCTLTHSYHKEVPVIYPEETINKFEAIMNSNLVNILPMIVEMNECKNIKMRKKVHEQLNAKMDGIFGRYKHKCAGRCSGNYH